MGIKRIPFQPEIFYHIYNHSVGNDLLFLEEKNYGYFLNLYTKHIASIAHTFAFCLMPNHFHFVIKIKSFDNLCKNLWCRMDQTPVDTISAMQRGISHKFGNLQNAYAKAINKMYKRRGTLFCSSINRKILNTDEYIKTAIKYVHLNPVNHGFVNNAGHYKYSSYNAYLNLKQTDLSTQLPDLVIFEGVEIFNSNHISEVGIENYSVRFDINY